MPNSQIDLKERERKGVFQYLFNKKMRPPTNTFREVLKVTASGTCTVLLSTAFSCVLAAGVETAAHRIQYKFFPHWVSRLVHVQDFSIKC